MYNNILISINEGIATLTINRPSKLNALNHETLSEIKDAVSGFYTIAVISTRSQFEL